MIHFYNDELVQIPIYTAETSKLVEVTATAREAEKPPDWSCWVTLISAVQSCAELGTELSLGLFLLGFDDALFAYVNIKSQEACNAKNNCLNAINQLPYC